MAKGFEPLMTEYESIVFPIKLYHLAKTLKKI